MLLQKPTSVRFLSTYSPLSPLPIPLAVPARNRDQRADDPLATETNELMTQSARALSRDRSIPSQPYGFLNTIIQPLYNAIKGEADSNVGGKLPHAKWRNYDDFNEFFWSPRCFDRLSWPPNQSAVFFIPPNKTGHEGGKTGFVEQRTILNMFRSFDRVWILLIFAFQVLILALPPGPPSHPHACHGLAFSLDWFLAHLPPLFPLLPFPPRPFRFHYLLPNTCLSACTPAHVHHGIEGGGQQPLHVPGRRQGYCGAAAHLLHHMGRHQPLSCGVSSPPLKHVLQRCPSPVVILSPPITPIALADMVMEWRLIRPSNMRFNSATYWSPVANTALFWLLIAALVFMTPHLLFRPLLSSPPPFCPPSPISLPLSVMWNARKAATYWSPAANTVMVSFLIAALVFMTPHLLGILLFLTPEISRRVEASSSSFIRVRRMLVTCLEDDNFVGRGMREDTWDSIKYSIFWLLLLTGKFAFSYFLLIRPMVEPTKALLNTTIHYTWPELYKSGNYVAVFWLWAPVGVIYIMDLSIFYAIFSSVVGYIMGVFAHIGEVRKGDVRDGEVSHVKLLTPHFRFLPRPMHLNPCLMCSCPSRPLHHALAPSSHLHISTLISLPQVSHVKLLTLRFRFLPRAMHLNLLPPSTNAQRRGGMRSAMARMWNRMAMTYGLVSPDTWEMDERWAVLWNSVIGSFREEDLLSDAELNLLSIPEAYTTATVSRWPIVLLADQVVKATTIAGRWKNSSSSLWRRLCSSDFCRCAVLETFALFRLLLSHLLIAGTPEHRMVQQLLAEIDGAASGAAGEAHTDRDFVDDFNLGKLPAVQAKLVALTAFLLRGPTEEELPKATMLERQRQHAAALCPSPVTSQPTSPTLPPPLPRPPLPPRQAIMLVQNLHEVAVRDFWSAGNYTLLLSKGVIPRSTPPASPLYVGAIHMPDPSDPTYFAPLQRLHSLLTCHNAMATIPANPEARRRVTFFCNSLFMAMPPAPTVQRMRSFCVMTPYYNESVMYSPDELRWPNEDGISLLYYLQNIFPDEWKNLEERLGVRGREVWEFDDGAEVCRWASYRGQTLTRTVRGIMYYHSALDLLSYFDTVPDEPLVRRSYPHTLTLPLPYPPPSSPHRALDLLSYFDTDPDAPRLRLLKPTLTMTPSSPFLPFPHRALDLLSYFDTDPDAPPTEGRELHSKRQTTSAPPAEEMSAAAAAAAAVASAFGGSGRRPDAGWDSQGSVEHMREQISQHLGQQREYDPQFSLADVKFTYVVACQIYGEHKRKNDPKARHVLELMQENPALRIAYVDEQPPAPGTGGGTRYYSVLVKWDQWNQREVEIFRVQLPGPIKIGEGKPENQNHAIIFTRGEALQTIDMNQDSYLEEALKIRNFLEEFSESRRRILGMREHVFTGSVSSLAAFMSAQETAFVTIGQRVLYNPLKVRMHYGHPDVFDRVWSLARGGISKASRVINISEDIFAGFNTTLRRGAISHHEYIQVGKGRDVGLNQISLFEAKVASGNGEQLLSRDVYRLGHGLDMFRLLSFYTTSIGFFFSTALTAMAVYAFLWGRCYMVLSGVEETISSSDNQALSAAINQQFLVQLMSWNRNSPFFSCLSSLHWVLPTLLTLIAAGSDESSFLPFLLSFASPLPQIGLFTSLPMLMELILEKGTGAAIWEFLLMHVQLCFAFFTFSLGTRAHYFLRTLMHGGAKYRATGRGFVVKHEPFVENYRLYSRSHFNKAVELLLCLVIYMLYSSLRASTAYWLLSLSAWILVLSWLLAPFAFNPLGFDWLKCCDDWEEWTAWLWAKGGKGVTEKQAWVAWWDEERAHLKTTGWGGWLVETLLALRWFFFQYALVYRLDMASASTSILVYVYSWLFIFAMGLFWISLTLCDLYLSIRAHLLHRAVKTTICLVFLAAFITALSFTNLSFSDVFLLPLVFLPTGWGFLQLTLVVAGAFPVVETWWTWGLVRSFARTYEFIIGVIVFLPMAVLSWLPGVQDMQTKSVNPAMGLVGEILGHPDEFMPLLRIRHMAKMVSKLPDDEDFAFCYGMLNRVSRSFAFVIQQLHPLLRDPDDMAVPIDEKVPILIAFHQHICDPDWKFVCGTKDHKDLMQRLHHVPSLARPAIPTPLSPLPLVPPFPLLPPPGGTKDYKDLMQRLHHVRHALEKLEPRYKAVILDITRRMGAGMASFITTEVSPSQPLSAAINPSVPLPASHSQPLSTPLCPSRPVSTAVSPSQTLQHNPAVALVSVETVPQYDEYCHYVAGLVGIGLSDLFHAANLEEAFEESLSNSMGLFLQKTNIIRDYLEDITEEPAPRMFWPKAIWGKYAARLEDLKDVGSNGAAAVKCVNELVTNALGHVSDCLTYMHRLRDPQVFRFCAIPQIMAMGTLALCYNNIGVFEGVVKMRKGLAAKVMEQTWSMADVRSSFTDFGFEILKKLLDWWPAFCPVSVPHSLAAFLPAVVLPIPLPFVRPHLSPCFIAFSILDCSFSLAAFLPPLHPFLVTRSSVH
ncbi:unnamed protein product [Closterium sp. Naga37s-1]|nr:unnamed protein product [Closterium sp. Naga37s-1]